MVEKCSESCLCIFFCTSTTMQYKNIANILTVVLRIATTRHSSRMGRIPQATGRTSFVCLYYTKSLAIKFYSQLKQFCLRHFNSTTSGQTTDVNSTLNEFTRHILQLGVRTLPENTSRHVSIAEVF